METRRPEPAAKRVQSVHWGPFVISSCKSHILPSEGPERTDLEAQVHLPQFPEMIFHENAVQIRHKNDTFGMEFFTLDALKMIDTTSLPAGIKIAATEAWRASRQNCEFIDKEVVKPFDWTFTTEYMGTLRGDEFVSLVEPTEEQIDLERLKVKEQILFYDDVCLFEDELGDNGTAMLSVKIRCMPTCLFLLMRFFLRVDDVLVRIVDTRLFHSVDTSHFLREFSVKEARVEQLAHLPPHVLTDPVAVADHLHTVKQQRHRLPFPAPTGT